MRTINLPPRLAAIALASESNIPISRFATDEDLAAIRAARVMPQAISTVLTLEGISRKETTRPGKRKDRVGQRVGKPRRGTNVFVVHGRDERLRRAIFSFLRSIGLNPMEWRKAIELTGKPNPYVGEILDAAFREAAAVVVVLSPDDEARLRSDLVKQDDPETEKKLTGQARPNVLFEAGMAFGRNPDSTVLVQIGQIRPFSDIGGRHVVRLSNSPESRSEFATKLANAGCNVDLSGTDWIREGEFEASGSQSNT